MSLPNNLPGGETLLFRASSRRRFRCRTLLQQIWTRPRPGPSQEPHPHHSAPARVTTAIPTREPTFPARKAHRFISASDWPPGECGLPVASGVAMD